MVVFLEPARREDGGKQNVEDRLSHTYSDCFGKNIPPDCSQVISTSNTKSIVKHNSNQLLHYIVRYRYMCSSLIRIGIVYIAKFHYAVVIKWFLISYLDMIVTIQLILDG